jgi:predicted RNA-binding Zn ribbon-like protein
MMGAMVTTPYEAPGGLELVRQFVNSRDVEKSTDALADVSGLAGWYSARGLLEAVAPVHRADVAHAQALREALRDALLSNHDRRPPPSEAVRELNAAARRASLRPVLESSGQWRARPTAGGAEAALGAIVAVVAEAMGGPEWPRLKVCVNDRCLWAFFDRSRSHARRWCSMEICGNRVKQQAWRGRQR